MTFEIGIDGVEDITRTIIGGGFCHITKLQIGKYDSIDMQYREICIIVNSKVTYNIHIKSTNDPKVYLDNLIKQEIREDKINKILG